MTARGAGARRKKSNKKGKRKIKQDGKRNAKRNPKRNGDRSRLARLFMSRWALVALAAFVVLGIAGFLVGRDLGRAPGSGPYLETVARWCRTYNVNADLATAVLETESSGLERAVSSAGALGLMQLMPPTAAAMAKELGLEEPSREDLFEPELNIRLGVYYLSKLSRRFGEERPFVLAAYNAGPTCVDRWRRRRADLPAAEIIDELAYPATRLYVRRVLRRWRELAGSKTRSRG